jgi:ribonuclease HI
MPTTRSKPAIVARIDGASRGNPGPAAYGVVIETAEGNRLANLAKRLGQTTNNFAEYQALLAALEYALQHKHLRVKVFSDSELLVRQMQGVYKVKSSDLKPLYNRARGMVAQLEIGRAHV